MTVAITLAAAALVGAILGLLGGGGSVLTVPVLLYLAHVPAKSAIAMSLFVVAVTSLAGLIPHARAGRVQWRTGAVFAAAGTVGAYTGGRLAGYVPDAVLLTGFAVMMAVTAAAMLRPRRGSDDDADRPASQPRVALILVQGAAVGALTGLVGAGGGFVIVPALILLGGLRMSSAVGTSLLVLTAQSAAGFAGHLQGAHLDWPLTLAVTAVAVAAALLGARWSGRIDAARLRRIFGTFVAAMSVVVLVEQAPPGWRPILLGLAAGSIAATVVAVAAIAAVPASPSTRYVPVPPPSCGRAPSGTRTRQVSAATADQP
jgi:uncharacterized membrane protein YfcA